MTDQSIFDKILDSSFFDGMRIDDLERLSQIARIQEFAPNSEVFHKSDIAKDVYVITSGNVVLTLYSTKHGWRQLMKVSEGDLIGWSPLVGRHRLTDTARTVEATRVIAFEGEKLLDLCRETPEFGFEFMHRTTQVLAQRVTALIQQLEAISGYELPKVQIESD